MKRISSYAILALCVAALAVPAIAQPASEAATAPKAVVDEPVFDAQRIGKGQDIVHDFVVKNEGNAPLHITDVRPACGCTVAEYDEVIAPGSTGKVHAVIDTTGFQGAISKGITVLTDDPENPHLVLTVKALVEPMIFVRPGYARFIQPQMSEPGQVEELLFTRTFEGLKVLSAKSPYPFLDVEFHQAKADELDANGEGNQWIVTLTLDYEKAPVGALADYVMVTTNHPQQKEVPIAISGFVRPMMVVTPQDLDFGKIQITEESAQARLVLKNYAREDIDVSFKDATIPGVKVTVAEVEPGREYSLEVLLGPELPKGDFSGVIHLNVNHPKQKTVDIPLRGSRI
jgi:Protein of unknown function (DUF1573)